MKRRKRNSSISGSQISTTSLSILRKIQQGFQEKKQEIILSNPVKEPLSKDNIVQGPQFQYIPHVIRQYILKHDWKHRYKIQQGFSVNRQETGFIQFTVYIYTDQDEDMYPDILATFSLLLDYVSQKDTLKSKYELYLYATPFLKQFPEKMGELIDEIHANSGFTVKTDPVPIYVFRQEESRRVCIHEILHALGFDGIHPETGAAPAEGKDCINLLKPIQGQHLCDGNDGVRIYEALTETQATILNVLFQNPKSGSFLIKALRREKQHVDHQIQEINRHYGITNENYRGYKQGVSKTISYFLFRGFLMDKMDRFIKNTLLFPQSIDYVKIIEEGIKKHGQKKTKKVLKRVGKNRKTLKMNYSE